MNLPQQDLRLMTLRYQRMMIKQQRVLDLQELLLYHFQIGM